MKSAPIVNVMKNLRGIVLQSIKSAVKDLNWPMAFVAAITIVSPVFAGAYIINIVTTNSRCLNVRYDKTGNKKHQKIEVYIAGSCRHLSQDKSTISH
jgi:hypothetical protein